MNNRVRYTAEDVKKHTFYQMPKFLFEGEFKNLNNDARVLYSVLKDRHELSLINQWVNEDNEVYIIFSRTEMCEVLGLSDKPITKAMNTLKQYNLIEEERPGQGYKNKIYLLTVKVANIPLNRRISDSELGDKPTPESENLRFSTLYNKTNVSDTNHSQRQTEFSEIEEEDSTTDDDIENNADNENNNQSGNNPTSPSAPSTVKAESKIYDYDTVKQNIQNNIEYSHYAQHKRTDIELIDELIDCILDVIFTKGDTVKINGEKKDRNMVINQYLKINSSDIDHVLDQYKEQHHKIIHLHNYLKTMLYTVKQEQGHFYTNAVRVDGLFN